MRLFENDDQVARLTGKAKRRYFIASRAESRSRKGTLCHFRLGTRWRHGRNNRRTGSQVYRRATILAEELRICHGDWCRTRKPAMLKRFIYRFARFTSARRQSDRHTGSRRRRCTRPPPDQDAHRRVSVLTTSTCRPVRRSAARAKRATATIWSVTVRRGHRHCGSSTPIPGRRIRREGSVKSGCR
jgi:hypothetical protein